MACFGIWAILAMWAPIGLAETTAGSWLVAALFSAMIGLLQYFGATSFFGPWVNSTAVGEAFGNLRQRNQFATLMTMGLLALLCWVGRITQTQTGIAPLMNKETAWRAGLVCAALLGAGNAASSSRTGLVQLLLVAGLMWGWGFLRQPLMRRVILVAVLSYVVATVALPLLAGLALGGSGILGRINGPSSGCASRLVLWSNVLHLIAQKPWLGWGWGNLDYAHFLTLYPGGRFCDILDNAHNLPLHLAVELGVPAALLICGSGLWLIWRARPWRERDASRQMAWGVMAVILLHSMVEYPLWYGPFQIAFGLCVALLWQPDWGKNGQLVRVITGVFAAIFIACIGYASWDYHRISQIYMIPKMRDAAYREDTFDKIKDSWLFQNQVKFAELTTSSVTFENAEHLNSIAHDLLHFSPEAKVAIKLIESAVMLGRDEEAKFFLIRLKVAFPVDHARWVQKNAG